MAIRSLKLRRDTNSAPRTYSSYLIAQNKESKPLLFQSSGPGPAITISYQTGSGEHEIADRLAKILQATESGRPVWRVFDRQLVEQALREHQFPPAMARFMQEDHRSIFEEEIGDILGLHPPAWVVVPQITETVLGLATAGHVILVGRAAVFITARMTKVFHVRLVAPLNRRVERIQRVEKLTAAKAGKFIASNDRGRSRYARAYYHGRPDDDTLYHLVINTDRIPSPEAAQLIAEQARICFEAPAGALE